MEVYQNYESCAPFLRGQARRILIIFIVYFNFQCNTEYYSKYLIPQNYLVSQFSRINITASDDQNIADRLGAR